MGARHLLRRTAVISAIAAFGVSHCASAATFYVDDAVPASGDCLSPATACKTIADAITKERGTGEADVINIAAGRYVETVNLNTAGDGGLTIIGAGAGSDTTANTVLQSNSGGANLVSVDSPNTSLAIRNLRLAMTGTASGKAIAASDAVLAIGAPGAPVVVDMTNGSSNSAAIATGGPADSTSTLDHVTVGGSWTGAALLGLGNTIVTDSTFATGPSSTAVTIVLNGPGRFHARRSVMRTGNPSSTVPIISDVNGDVIVESSEVLGGGGIYFLGAAGKAHALTIASSTLDSSVLGTREDSSTTPAVTVEAKNAAASVTARIDGSILMEGPKAVVSGGATATVTCTSSDVPSTSQAATASVGAIDCATGSNGNTFTASPGDLFANAAPDYTLKPSASAIDSVPESAIVLPAGVTASSTDLAGAGRVLNAVGTCNPGIRDKGALELTGHAGVPPIVSIAVATGAPAGEAMSFGGSVSNKTNLDIQSWSWAFSDGGTATDQNASHAFAQAGPATATLTVTDTGNCVGTAKAGVTIFAAPLAVITGLKLTPSAFFAKPSGATVVAAAKVVYGTVVSYTGTQAATTTFTVQRARPGRRVGKRCRKPTRKNRGAKRCSRYVAVGSFKHTDPAGAVRFRFTGRVARKTLAAGRYRLRAVPRNDAGKGKATFRKFQIKRPAAKG